MNLDPVSARSPWLFRSFGLYLRWYFSRNFRALRLSRAGFPEIPAGRPVIICVNHPSWWDPLIYILIMGALFRERRGFGPMDRKALGRYGILRRMGIFGVEPGTARGSADFLHTCDHILQDPAHILWITAEGEFTDPRKRPVTLRPGIAHLARRAKNAVIVPMAMEYCFWNERFPEALIRFGRPITAGDGVAEWRLALEAGLQETMDGLADDAMSRDPARFHRIRRGRTGMGGIYNLYRRVSAALKGQSFEPNHTPTAPASIADTNAGSHTA